jgi:hypothetical protein
MKDNGTSAGIEKKLVSRAMTPEELFNAKNKYIELKEQQDDLMQKLAIITATLKGQIKPIAEESADLLATIRRKHFNVEENCEKVLFYDENKVRYYSCTTGELVLTREMNVDERQQELPLDTDEPEADTEDADTEDAELTAEQLAYEEEMLNELNDGEEA